MLRLAGAPRSALVPVKDIVDTCRICRAWLRPSLKCMATTRLARDFNDIVQWDICFVRRYVVSHLLDEAIRWTAAVPMPDKTLASGIEGMATTWLQARCVREALGGDVWAARRRSVATAKQRQKGSAATSSTPHHA